MRLVRTMVGVWLLIAFGAYYAYPAITAPTARAAGCCPTDSHHSCCRRHVDAAGSYWLAFPQCGRTCRMPASLLAHICPAVAPALSAVNAALAFESCGGPAAEAATPSSHFAFLYQRPPPAQF
jgi:hypothetical protein